MRKERSILIEEQGLSAIICQKITIEKDKYVAYLSRIAKAGFKSILLGPAESLLMLNKGKGATLIASLNKENLTESLSIHVSNENELKMLTKNGLSQVQCSVSASDSFANKLWGHNSEASVEQAKRLVIMARAEKVYIKANVLCAFGCPIQGLIDPREVMRVARILLDEGIDELNVTDTSGMADPMTLYDFLSDLMLEAYDIPVSLRCSNREGKALANIYAGVQAGLRRFDTSFGGISSDAVGVAMQQNTATEDAVHMLKQMGFDVGIQPEPIAAMSQSWVKDSGNELPGHFYKLMP